MNEILDVDDLSAWLKMSRRSIYELTRVRTREKMRDPLPVLRINGNVRFRRCDVENWLQKLAQGESQ